MTDYRNDARWSVYVHIVPKNISGYEYDKYYVGMTSLSPKARWGANGINYYSQFFYKSIQKYGWDNIQHEVIASLITIEEAKQLEKTLIRLLDSNSKFGYNLTDGGDVIDTNEVVDLYQFDICGNYIGMCNDELFDNQNIIRSVALTTSKQKKRYKDWIFATKNDIASSSGTYILNDYNSWDLLGYVFEFDRNNNYIRGFPSMLQASKETNISFATIENMIHHKYSNTYMPYIFRTIEDIEIENGIPKIKNYNNNNRIFKFNVFNQLIDIYNTREEAIKNNKDLTYSNLDNYLYSCDDENYHITRDGEIYVLEKYVLKLEDTYKINNLCIDNCHFIFCFLENTFEYVGCYKNSQFAEKELNVPNYNIRHSARNKTKKSKSGYIFRYINDVKKLQDDSFELIQ